MQELIVGIITDSVERIKPLLQDFSSLEGRAPDLQFNIVILLNGLIPADTVQLWRGELTSLFPAHFLIDIKQQQRDAYNGFFGEKFNRSDNLAPIVETRTMLQRYLLEVMAITPEAVGLIIDDDFRLTPTDNSSIPNQLIEQLRLLPQARKMGVDVVLGSIAGISPNPPLHGLQGTLFDALVNLRWIQTLSPGAPLPNRKPENVLNRKRFEDYYYDLSHKHTEHVTTPFWLEPAFKNESVREARARLLKDLPFALHGLSLTRSIKPPAKDMRWYHSVNRGGITFILNSDALSNTPNVGVRHNGLAARRSDMIWAILNRDRFGLKIVQSDITFYHRGETHWQGDVSIQKVHAELIGSALYKAMCNSQDIEEIVSSATKYLREREKELCKSLEVIGLLSDKICNIVHDKAIETTMNYVTDLSVALSTSLPLLTVERSFREFLMGLEGHIQDYQEALQNVRSTLDWKNEHTRPDLHSRKGGSLSHESIKNFAHCGLLSKHGTIDHYRLPNAPWSMITKGRLKDIVDNPIVRIHSSCFFSEVLNTMDCDCAQQLQEAIKVLSEEGPGEVLFFYLEQEGRGHGLYQKTRIIDKMNREHLDTYQACEAIGLKHDVREFLGPIQVLKELGIESVRLMSNNPYKLEAFQKAGFMCEVVPTLPTVNSHNEDYLRSKREHGHSLYFTGGTPIEFYRSQDAFGWLSNFAPFDVLIDNQHFLTVEHYYQYSKFHADDIRLAIQIADSPKEAKKLADKHVADIVPTWEKLRDSVMLRGLLEKFSQHPRLLASLLNTEDRLILECSPSDSYWGTGVDGEGKNRLGLLLMEVREKLREKEELSCVA